MAFIQLNEVYSSLAAAQRVIYVNTDKIQYVLGPTDEVTNAGTMVAIDGRLILVAKSLSSVMALLGQTITP